MPWFGFITSEKVPVVNFSFDLPISGGNFALNMNG